MVLFIEILDGSHQGSRFKIEPGHIIGRNRGEIAINDEKISSQHARFEVDNKGQFVLMDLDSSNGILSGNRRVKKIAMMPGVIFRLGKTSFRVISVEGTEAQDFSRLRTWKENLADKLPLSKIQNHFPDDGPKPFSPTLQLKFIQGLQADETLLLGYGPRRAGALSLDIDLLDPEAPDLAFEIIPGEGLAHLKNLCRDKLSLNKKPANVEILQDGDIIGIGGTLIKVNYI